jgi:hypothetical protein
MAAIIPGQEDQKNVPELTARFYRCVGNAEGLNGPGLAAEAYCPSPQEVEMRSHQELFAMTYVRDAVERDLLGRSFTVQQEKNGEVKMVLDGPIGAGPPWNPSATPNAQSFSMLAWTSKMQAPSWSLPAGAPQMGGACPGATGGQSIVPLATLRKGRDLVAKYVENMPLGAAICESCYATGGQYGTGNVQYAQVLRFIWARQAIQEQMGSSTAFVETMTAAIANADFKLAGGKVQAGEDRKVPPEPSGRRFFRLHDSGDFFSIPYLEQWKAVCERFPDITFWAPSRVWAAGSKWVDAVNEINRPRGGKPSNLVIRPSAFYVNGHAPRKLGPGWASGSTVVDIKVDGGPPPDWKAHVERVEGHTMPVSGNGPDERFQWSCRAYSSGSTKTCRSAAAPPGMGDPDTGRGCRVCWIMPDVEVNYHPH